MSGELISTLDSPGEFDALAHLRPDEPYFLLLARDRLAPALVQKWADENRARALAERENMSPEAYERELRKSTEAEAIGWAMQAYKAGQNAKAVQERQITTYSGHELPEEIKRRDLIQAARSRAAQALNNAVAEVDALRQLFQPEESMAILCEHIIAQMVAASDQIAPPRISDKRPTPLLDSADG